MRIYEFGIELKHYARIQSTPGNWIGDLARQPHKAGLKINMEPNLLPDRLKEYPIG